MSTGSGSYSISLKEENPPEKRVTISSDDQIHTIGTSNEGNASDPEDTFANAEDSISQVEEGEIIEETFPSLEEGTINLEEGTNQEEGTTNGEEAEECDEEDEEERMDDSEETILERLWGLTEMFPEPVREMAVKVARNFQTFYNTTRNYAWIIVSSSVVLFIPLIIEFERDQIDEMELKYQHWMQRQHHSALPPCKKVTPPPPPCCKCCKAS